MVVLKDSAASADKVVEAGLKFPLGTVEHIFLPLNGLVCRNDDYDQGLKLVLSFKFFSVAKPLWIDGTAKSHQLYLAYDRRSLAELEPPLVLQEFVNHGIGFNETFQYTVVPMYMSSKYSMHRFWCLKVVLCSRFLWWVML